MRGYPWENTEPHDPVDAYRDSEQLIFCIDFDGVLHDYKKVPWKGADVIEGPPIDGALDWLADMVNQDVFDVMVYSARSHQHLGILAMYAWLRAQSMKLLGFASHIDEIYFPKVRPPAWVSIDDRCMTFTGRFPETQDLIDFGKNQ